MMRIWESLKNKSIAYGLVIVSLVSSCSLGGGQKGPNYYFRPVIYEYNIANKTYSKIKAFDITNMGYDIPCFQYFHNNSKIIYLQNRRISILDLKSKKENIIELDSLLVVNNYFSLSPIENKIAFSGTSSAISRGLYLLDLDTKRIQVVEHNRYTDINGFYDTPIFSNNGKLVAYSSFKGIYTVDVNTNKTEKIYKGGRFATFDNTDKIMMLLEEPQRLLSINLISNKVDTIDNSHYHQGSELLGYPHFLITASNVFYTCESAITYPQDHQLYRYDVESNKSTYLMQGIMPMSENYKDNTLLIRASCNYEEKGSPIEIITPDGQLVETLKSGNRATFSPDGNKVLLLILEEAYVD